MADRDNRLVTYVTDREKRQLAEYAQTAEKSMSHLLREAVLEYLDHDRTARLEERLDEIESHLATIAADADTHTHKPQGGMKQATEATEKARAIVRRLQTNHDDVMQTAAVDRAIEDIAGVDNRTKRKYKRLFKRRGILFAHPGDRALWTVEQSIWMDWLQDFAALNGQEETERVTEDYSVVVHATSDGVQIEVKEELNGDL